MDEMKFEFVAAFDYIFQTDSNCQNIVKKNK